MEQNNNTNSRSRNNEKMDQLKHEVVQELGIDLNSKNLTAREAGRVGGNMVKKMMEMYKQDHS